MGYNGCFEQVVKLEGQQTEIGWQQLTLTGKLFGSLRASRDEEDYAQSDADL